MGTVRRRPGPPSPVWNQTGHVSPSTPKERGLFGAFRSRPLSQHGTAALIVELAPRSPAAEAFRTLRTNLQFRSLTKPYRSLAITSAGAGEGKTTVAANFGAVLAQAGSRVCLIDSDLRRPSLHRVFGLAMTRGLTTALVEGLPPTAVGQRTHIPDLTVVTSGPLPPNPAELVASPRMREFLDAGTREFDVVLCDTPPILAVADGVALAAQCDGVILVVAAGAVPTEVVRRASEQITAVKADIVGVLLNRVNLHRDGYYAAYYRYDQQDGGGNVGSQARPSR
jgi:protein-tyrosine kinase